MLEVRSLSISYGAKRVVDRFSFTLDVGKILALVGRSGCGKSTILSALAGTLLADGGSGADASMTGRISWEGNELNPATHRARLMPQNDLLLPWLKVVDNVALPLRLRAVRKRMARELAQQFLRQFKLHDYSWHYPGQLSGGMRQRVALLRTCIDVDSAAPLVLLDEPFTRLDPLTREECRSWAKQLLRQLATTTLLVTHDIEEAIDFADAVLVLSSATDHAPGSEGDSVHRIDIAADLSPHDAVDLKEKIRSYL